jgi:hypothetical protein
MQDTAAMRAVLAALVPATAPVLAALLPLLLLHRLSSWRQYGRFPHDLQVRLHPDWHARSQHAASVDSWYEQQQVNVGKFCFSDRAA